MTNGMAAQVEEQSERRKEIATGGNVTTAREILHVDI